jgi:hypothetical protein
MTPTEQEQAINEIEKAVDRLHALYNQYFMGIEKIEPTVPRKNLDRKINIMRREHIKNTALRFRLQMQIQRYNTQSTYWNRICREIENGTYKRHIMLAKRRVDARHGSTIVLPSQRMNGEGALRSDMLDGPGFQVDLEDLELGLDEPFDYRPVNDVPASGGINSLDDPFGDMNSEKMPPNLDIVSPGSSKEGRSSILSPKRPENKQRQHPPTPSVSKQTSASDADTEGFKTIYRRYLAAKKKCNEPIAGITYEVVAKSLKEKMRTANDNIDFKVVIKGGKAVIKSVKKNQ